MHVKGALDGAEAYVPQFETILAVESVPRYRTLTHKLEEYPAEVECSHLEEQADVFCKRERHGIHGSNAQKEDRVSTYLSCHG